MRASKINFRNMSRLLLRLTTVKLMGICLFASPLALSAETEPKAKATDPLCKLLLTSAEQGKPTTGRMRNAQLAIYQDSTGRAAGMALGDGGIAHATNAKNQATFAHLSVEKNPEAVMAALPRLQLSKQDKYELALKLAVTHFDWVQAHSEIFNFTPEQKVEILKVFITYAHQVFKPIIEMRGEHSYLKNGAELTEIIARRTLDWKIPEKLKGAIVRARIYNVTDEYRTSYSWPHMVNAFELTDQNFLLSSAIDYSDVATYLIKSRKLSKLSILSYIRNKEYSLEQLFSVVDNNIEMFGLSEKERIEILEGYLRRWRTKDLRPLFWIMQILNLKSPDIAKRFAAFRNEFDELEDLRLAPPSPEQRHQIAAIVNRLKPSFEKNYDGQKQLNAMIIRLASSPTIPSDFIMGLYIKDVGTDLNVSLITDLNSQEIARAIQAFAKHINNEPNRIPREFVKKISAKNKTPILLEFIRIGRPIQDIEEYINIPNRRDIGFAAAKASIDNWSGYKLKEFAETLNFSYNQRLDLALANKRFAEEVGLDIFKSKDRLAILQRHSAKGNSWSSQNSLTDSQKIDSAILASRNGNRQSFSGLAAELGLSVAFPLQDRRLMIAVDPLAGLNTYFSLQSNNILSEETPAAKIKEYLDKLAQMSPILLRESEAQWITAIPNSGVMLSLLSLKAELDLRSQKQVEVHSAIQLVALTLGLSVEDFAKSNFGQVHLPALIVIARDIVRQSGWQKFKKMNVDPEIFQKSQNHTALLNFLNVYRNYLSLKNIDGSRVTQDPLTQISHLSMSTMLAATDQLKQSVVNTIEGIFREVKLEFTYADLDNLQKNWGDLEPVFTLLARYKGSKEWQKEIPVLGRIFKFSLANKFLNYKFHGNPEDTYDVERAKDQLSMLTPEQIEKWKTLHTQLSILSPQGGNATPISDADTFQRAHTIIVTALVPNLSRKKIDAASSPADILWRQKEIGGLLPSATNPMAFLESLRQNTSLYGDPVSAGNRILSDLVTVLSTTQDLKNMRILARAALLLVQKRQVPHLLKNAVEEAETKADLTTVNDWLNPKVQNGAGEKAIVFTTTLHHPKSLLTIGDLVQAASCQNYRIGSMIQTLPGYVIDANVIGMVGYALTPAQFSTGDDFNKLYALMQSGVTVRARLDEIKKTIQFRWRDQSGRIAKIESINIPYAQHRQVIKIGRGEDTKAAIFGERPYAQNHFASSAVVESANLLISGIAQDVGAKVGGKIKVVGSRNELGVYSDAGGGQKAQGTSYEVNVEMPKQ